VKPGTAKILAAFFSITGLLAAWLAGGGPDQPLNHTALVAIALLAAILLYDYALKETVFGPLVMGACRGLNLLMPMAGVGLQATELGGLAVAVMVLYIASVTWFGRDEAGRPTRPRLMLGGIGIMASLVVLAAFPAWNRSQDPMTLIVWLAVAVHMGRIIVRTIGSPTPQMVRYAMKTFILGVVAVDATFATAAAGWYAGTVVLLLLIPAAYLGRRLYST
jgi:4-hydroxybenzoate polyprenyltransferase